MKLFNFITYFTKLRHQHFKVVYVTFRTKIDFHLPSQMSLSFPLAQFPAISKSKGKGTHCLHVPSSDFLLYPSLWKEVCWIRHKRNCICNFAFDPTFSFLRFSSKRVTRELNLHFLFRREPLPILFPISIMKYFI